MKIHRYKDKVVLIVGATGGIGEVVSRRMSEEYAKLILFSRNSKKLDELEKSLSSESIKIVGSAFPGNNDEAAYLSGLYSAKSINQIYSEKQSTIEYL